jgi:hypothetical protein
MQRKHLSLRACASRLLWDDLLVYVLDGRIETDNNEIENSIRSTAVGKKNWLFIGAAEAGSRSAILSMVVDDVDERTVHKTGRVRRPSDEANELRPESDAVELPMPPLDRSPRSESVKIEPRATDPHSVEIGIKQRVERQGRKA